MLLVYRLMFIFLYLELTIIICIAYSLRAIAFQEKVTQSVRLYHYATPLYHCNCDILKSYVTTCYDAVI